MKKSSVEPEYAIPKDLQKALRADAVTYAKWKELTPIARRDFATWVESAKQDETRKRRIERTSSMLKEGKRRPCCYAVVPMGLYKALSENPKAQTTWKDLTPGERRDFVAWVESETGNARTIRIEKACALLAAGKRKI